MYNVHLNIPVARTLFELLSVDLKHFWVKKTDKDTKFYSLYVITF